MNEFKLVVKNKKPLIICITETWGKEWVNDGIFSLQGYTMYRNDRNGQVGGGTILYISDKVEHRVCRPLNAYDFDRSSWSWIVEKRVRKR